MKTANVPKLSELEASDVPYLITEVPGPESRRLWAREASNRAPGMSPAAEMSRLALSKGSGALVQDADGNVLIDFCSGTVVANIGNSHPRVVSALATAAADLMHCYDFVTRRRVELFEYLAPLLPPRLRTFQMYSTGGEAVDAALKAARSYTGGYEIVSFYRAFHGKTLAATSLMGTSRRWHFGPFQPGMLRSPNAYCYRCPLGLEFPSCEVACADMLDGVEQECSDGRIAAVIIEPVQGSGGVIPFPPEFLRKVRAFCDRVGALLIYDEILTGAGRTGTLWAFEQGEVEPDLLLFGKGLSSGFPVAFLAGPPEVMGAKPFAGSGASCTTFGGNPMAAAVALESLKVLVEENLSANAAKVGALLRERLLKLKDTFPVVGDVRGMGLLLGLELVRDPGTREPLSLAEGQFLYQEMLGRGLYTSSPGSIVRIVPPLCLSEELAERGVALFADSIAALQGRLDRNGVGDVRR